MKTMQINLTENPLWINIAINKQMEDKLLRI